MPLQWLPIRCFLVIPLLTCFPALAQEAPTADDKKVELYLGQLRHKDTLVRSDAIKELCRLGPKAKSAVPELIKMVSEKDDFVSNSAVRVLAAIGPEAKAAVPVLIERMKDKSASVRTPVASALGRIGQPEVVPVLLKGLEDPWGDVRIASARWLFKMEKHKKEAFAALQKELQADFWGFRHGALTNLQALGPDAKEAVPNIIPLLKDREVLVREAAANALRSIDSEAAKKAGVP